MADTLKFELVSPERKLASADAQSVTVPGIAGDMTAMPNHAPFLTTMRPGVVTVRDGASETDYVVTGGFAEVSPEAVSGSGRGSGRKLGRDSRLDRVAGQRGRAGIGRCPGRTGPGRGAEAQRHESSG